MLPMRSHDEVGNKASRAYKPVPFLMSGGGGYGVWADSFVEGTFDVRAADADVIKLSYAERSLRVVLIAGPDLTDVLAEYTRLAGRPRQPPG